MSKKPEFKDFTGLYSLSKTVRFELIPQGKTKENIETKGLIKEDEERAEKYKKVKKIIDEYHKNFIEEALQGLELKNLNDYYQSYIDADDLKRKDNLDKLSTKLRKEVAASFTGEGAKRLFSKELIKEDLIEFVKSEKEKSLINEFSNFTTYFTGFHENRKNMYSDEPKATSVAYRLVNDNLPKFIDNIKVFEKIKKTDLSGKFKQIQTELNEHLAADSVEELFTIQSFNKALNQTQIDNYNAIIGGKTLSDGTKIQGLNEYINLYNQRQADRKNRLPKFKPLYKQILSDRKSISWLPEEFESGNDNAVLGSIELFYQDIKDTVIDKNNAPEKSLKELLSSIEEYYLDKIYLKNDASLTDISQKLCGSWSFITSAIEADYEEKNPRKAKESEEKYNTRKEKYIKSFTSFSLNELDTYIKKVYPEGNEIKISDYYKQKHPDLFKEISQSYDNIKNILNTKYPEDKNLSQDEENIEKIKRFLDSLKELQHFIKPLLGHGNEPEKDERFYSDFVKLWDILNKLTPLYNKVRNYLTRKPYSQEKIKLNFENSTLLDGWDVNKEPANSCVLLRKEGLYYLGIMDKKHTHVFMEDFETFNEPCFEKMEYKFFKDITTMIPKCSTQMKDVKHHFENSNDDYLIENDKYSVPFKITKEIYELNNVLYEGKKKFQIDYLRQSGDEQGYKTAVKQWIEFCLSFLQSYKSTDSYGYDKIETFLTYDRIDRFYEEINKILYNISFRKIPESYINNLVDSGKLYFFQIYNKDFSPHSKGTPNMHTLYWKMLFDPDNLKDVVYKLNGQAEIFYRKAGIKKNDIIIHPANTPVKNKNKNNPKPESIFEYDIIKNRRYTVDKFQFHVPITLNFKAPNIKNINEKVNIFIKESTAPFVIGIDRGERHLLYLTLIDFNGNIVQQFSLNEIINEYQGNVYKTDFRNLLDKKESGRDEARKSWKTIENIKELKEGYLSQVVHKITELMIKYNALVILEDLNMGFKRGRQKVEKQVYQKFEKMLIDKLNYLADKKKNPGSEGGLLNAYQLSNRFESFQAMRKQNGFLFYIPAWNTSKIDPVTGFVNLFDTRYESIDKSREFFSKFESIRFNNEKNYFEFLVSDYSKFNGKAEGTRLNWKICTHGTRIESFRNPTKNNQWDSREINLTEEFEELFKDKIDINNSLKKSIAAQTDKAFFSKILHLFKLTVQMRNSKTGTDIDYMLSPVADSKGTFYDSRTALEHLPQNADANGAYNIARKGLWVIEQIKKADDPGKINIAISNREWLQFAQKEQQ